jgi:hypothetical protein
MTDLRWPLALLGLCLAATGLPAQGHHGGHGQQGRLSINVYPGRGFYLGSYGFYPYGISPYGVTTIRQVTLVYSPPTVVVVPRSRVLFEQDDDDPPRRRLDARPRDPVPPAEERQRPGPEALPVQPMRQEPPPKVEPPLPPPPPRPPELPMPPAPFDNPRDEYARLVGLGRTAFATMQYGRAAGRFRQAIALVANEPLAHLLLAQAHFASGKYHDAHDAILAGLALQPDYPGSRFRPRELYGANADDFLTHLQRLTDARQRHPDDPVLLFLSAHQLWFDGRKDEARPLFRRLLAAGAGPGRDAAERFLRAPL